MEMDNETINEMMEEADEFDSKVQVDDNIAAAENIPQQTIGLSNMDKIVEYALNEHILVCNALTRTNDARASWMSEASNLAITFLQGIQNSLESRRDANQEEDPQISVPAIFASLTMIDKCLRGMPITALNGTEDEWVDVSTHPNMANTIGKTMQFGKRNLPGTSFTIESIQINTRFPNVHRFNNDNRFAHRMDAIAYYEVETGAPISSVIIDDQNLRFIIFPYPILPTVNYYIDLRDGKVVKVENDTDPEIIGKRAPWHIHEIVSKDIEDHPEFYPELFGNNTDGRDENDEEDDEIDSMIDQMVRQAIPRAQEMGVFPSAEDSEDEDDSDSPGDIRSIVNGET